MWQSRVFWQRTVALLAAARYVARLSRDFEVTFAWLTPQMYKKMLADLQYDQINLTREYQKLVVEKEVRL